MSDLYYRLNTSIFRWTYIFFLFIIVTGGSIYLYISLKSETKWKNWACLFYGMRRLVQESRAKKKEWDKVENRETHYGTQSDVWRLNP
jgi:hypothetical protein